MDVIFRNGVRRRALQSKEEIHMYPVFSPLQIFVFWLDILMLPWKLMIAPAADSLTEAAASTNPTSVAGLDPVSPQEIGTSATDLSKDAEEAALAAKASQSAPGSEQDRTRVAAGQDHEVGHQARKSNTSRAAIKKPAKKVGNSRKMVKRPLGR
jgi:hypothetical protein